MHVFQDQTTKWLSLELSELGQDKLKTFDRGENSPFQFSEVHLSWVKKLNLFDNWLYHK